MTTDTETIKVAIEDVHAINLTFEDDHSLNGMSVEVIGVTPEQIAVAVFHLQHIANSLLDMATMQRMREQSEIAKVAADIRKGN